MEKLFAGNYKGKRVLVTGHTGFKGSWLTLWLKELGAEVCGVALESPTEPNHFDLLKLGIESHIVDIRDRDKLFSTFESFKPEVVFHLAAQALVRYSYENPIETYETNVMGTLNVLEASRRVGVESIVCITTDKCYENREWVWGYRENDPMGGHDPYSSSKGCVEILAASYRSSYFNLNDFGTKHNTLLATARAGNVIGGGDWALDRLIPDIAKATANKEKTLIRSPFATRPWQHVLEPLHGYLKLGAKLIEKNKSFAEAWNFGPDSDANITVGEVLTHMKREWSEFDFEIDKNADHPHEANLLMLDCSKARTFLKWHPVWSPKETFKYTSEWYKSFYQDQSIASAEQLKEFCSKL